MAPPFNSPANPRLKQHTHRKSLSKSKFFDRGLFPLCKTTLPLGLLLWGGSVMGGICGCGRKILHSYRDRRLFLAEV